MNAGFYQVYECFRETMGNVKSGLLTARLTCLTDPLAVGNLLAL